MAIDSTLLLYSITGVRAYQIEDGQERLLTPDGPQTLSLFLVPSSLTTHSSIASEKTHYHLQLVLPPELDISISAESTSVYHQYPQSYLIIRQDVNSKCGSITRIEFPSNSKQNTSINDDPDNFESILSECNIMLERELSSIPPYKPSSHNPKKAESLPELSRKGQIVLVDDDNGSVIGELGSDFQLVENTQLKPGVNDPVEITLPTDDNDKISIAAAPQSYIDLAMHPAYKDSTLISKASMASRLIVTTSGYVSKALNTQADNFTQKTKPNSKPLKFEPTTHANIRKVRYLTDSAAGLSARTVGSVTKHAQNFGAAVTKRNKIQAKDGTIKPNAKPGLINKSVIAFSTITDGIDQAGRNLLAGTSMAVTKVVRHKYGPEAGEITKNIGTGVRNVGLIYIDATGVTRRAIVKSVAKGMVVGRVPGGGNLVVGSSQETDSKDSRTNGDTLTSSFHISPDQSDDQKKEKQFNTDLCNRLPLTAAESDRNYEQNRVDTKLPPPYTAKIAGTQ